MRYIAVDKEAIPYRTRIRLDGRTFTLVFHYNTDGDFFTVDISRGDFVSYGNKLVLDRPLLRFLKPGMPDCVLLPLAEDAGVTRVGWNELGENVFLYLFCEDAIRRLVEAIDREALDS